MDEMAERNPVPALEQGKIEGRRSARRKAVLSFPQAKSGVWSGDAVNVTKILDIVVFC
jgi:hypothetical protein